MAYLRKERLPKGQPTKLLMKKIGPCKIVHKFGPTAYEIELPSGLGISPIFNVCDLFPFRPPLPGDSGSDVVAEDADWIKDLPPSKPL